MLNDDLSLGTHGRSHFWQEDQYWSELNSDDRLILLLLLRCTPGRVQRGLKLIRCEVFCIGSKLNSREGRLLTQREHEHRLAIGMISLAFLSFYSKMKANFFSRLFSSLSLSLEKGLLTRKQAVTAVRKQGRDCSRPA